MRQRRPRHSRLAIAAAVALALAAPTAQALRIEYVADARIERNDNILLTREDPVAVTMLRPGLGFLATHEGSALRLRVAGRADHYRYGDSRFDDALDGMLDARADWELIPERLSFGVQDVLTLQPVDTLAPDVPGNRQQVNVFAAGPTLRFELPGATHAIADLRYVRSDAEVTREFDSRRLDASLRVVRELGPTSTLSGNVQGQRVDFVHDQVATDYRRYDVFGRYQHRLRQLQLTLDAGVTRLDYPQSDRDSDNPLLRAQVEWIGGERHRLGLRAARQYSDVATRALAGLDPGGIDVPQTVWTGDTVVNASPFREYHWALDYAFTGARLNITLSPYTHRVRYVDDTMFDRNGRGFVADASWQLRPRLVAGISAALARNDYLSLDRHDQVRRHGAYLRYAVSRHWHVGLEGERYHRESTEPGQQGRRNAFWLVVSYRNR